MKKILCLIFTNFIFINCSFGIDLSGRAVNIQTNKGEQNVKISLLPSDSSFEKLETVTDSDGIFVISGLKNNAEYAVKTENTKAFLVVPKKNKIQTVKSDIKDFDLAYYPKYSVSGTIDAGNIKAEGLNVMFKSGAPFFDNAASLVDERGRYKAEGLIYGQEYDAFVSSLFNLFGILGDSSITISSDNNVKNMAVVPVFYGTGMVFDVNTKKGIGSVTVRAVSEDGLLEQSTETSSDGSFVIENLYYGKSYIITAETQPGFGIPHEIKTGIVKSTVTGLDFPFTPE